MTGEALHGVYRATVTDNADPQLRGRVKIVMPAISTDELWAEVAICAGAEGPAPLLEIGARVVIAFEDSDPDTPIVIGKLWSGAA